jgi:hypothetical protein
LVLVNTGYARSREIVKQAAPSDRSSALPPAHLRRGRGAHIALAAGLVLALVFLLSAAVAAARPAGPGSQASGVVIVQSGDHDLVARPITFTAPVSRLRALELSGLEVITASSASGTVVCSIEGVGCPAQNCLCGGSSSWRNSYWDGNTWQPYPDPDPSAGPPTVNDGAVEGWRWGESTDALWPARPVTAALQALDWLRPFQSLTDGGYGGESSSAEILLSIGANGYPADVWRRQPGGPSLAGYWLGRARSYSSEGVAASAKLAVGAVATDLCWPRNAMRPSAYYSETSGTYAVDAGRQTWAILGTAALSETVPAQAVQYLKSLAQPNGGWEWQPGFGTDTNTTALALQALIATGEPRTSTVVTQGLAYLRSAQNADGGFTYDPNSPWGTDSDSNSTTYALQALLATGQDPASVEWSKGQNNPINFLLSLQLPDGSFEYQKGLGADQLSTRQAVVALLGRTFPLRVAQPRWCDASYLPVVSR